MPIKRPSDKNTKTEILSAFDQLFQEKKALEAQLQASKAEVKPNGKSGPEVVAIAPLPPQQKIESILDSLHQLQLNFGGAVSDLSEKLTLEAFQLQEMQQSVATEVQQLEALHSLQVSDNSLETLIQQYTDSDKTFSEAFEQRQEALDQTMTQMRKAWVKAQEDHRRLIQNRNQTQVKTQQRDGKEYTYDLALERQLATETYEQENQARYQAMAELQQTQEKQWAEREKAIATREKELADLKLAVESFPQDLEGAIKRAKEEGRGIAQHQAKVRADLSAKEVEGRKRVYELQVQSLQEAIATQNARIQTLSQQLDSALKQVQDLAVKAIEGASNANSFQTIREIAIEQAKTQAKNK